MLSILIVWDMEGTIGYSFSKGKEECISAAYFELKNVCRLLKSLGANQIAICNIHSAGKDLEKSEIEEDGIVYFEGVSNIKKASFQTNCGILLGFHGMAHSGGYYDHSFRQDIDRIEYEGKSIGEVGIFVRWLSNRGIPVILVSGEGNFENEICGNQCLFHKISKYSLEYEIERLSEKIDEAIHLYETSRHNLVKYDNKVYLSMTNTDKNIVCFGLEDCWIEGKDVVFLSIDVLVSQLSLFARELNIITNIVFDRNRLLAKAMKIGCIKKDLSIFDDFLINKDYLEISKNEWDYILSQIERKEYKDV